METGLGLSVSLSNAVQHAKNCIGGENFILKTKQVFVFRVLYQGKYCFVWLSRPYWLWQESLLPASTVFIRPKI